MERTREAAAPRGGEPCVWMSAGLVAYKLCDRDFDCEHCALDAALRGSGMREAERVNGAPAVAAWTFPEGRTYSPGHLWMQPREENAGPVVRLGVDVFAAALLGQCRHVRPRVPADGLRIGQPFCELDLDVGTLPLRAPAAGAIVSWNDALRGDPSLVVTDPYGEGWLADMCPQPGDGEIRWAEAARARKRARLDLRRFRRSVAMRMLAADVGTVLADGGARITDLRQMLGASAYRELLCDLIH